MDVLLNDEEKLVASSAREFLQGECSTALVREMEEDPLGYSPELWAKHSGIQLQGAIAAPPM